MIGLIESGRLVPICPTQILRQGRGEREHEPVRERERRLTGLRQYGWEKRDLDSGAEWEVLEDFIAPGDRHGEYRTIRFDRKSGGARLGNIKTATPGSGPFGKHTQRLPAIEDLARVTHGPGVLFTPIDRKCTQVPE
jgi:hypothetical protein